LSRNLESFRLIFESFAAGDLERALERADPDLVFEPRRSATEGSYLGHDGFRRYAADTREAFGVFRLDYTDVRDLGDDRVLAIGTVVVRGRESGLETTTPTASITTFRNGLAVRYKDYGESRAALEAAGLDD
jgi:ketosteroid isomerase-like protein